jgi:hypothetical protein
MSRFSRESIGRFCPRARTVKKKRRLSLFDLVCFSLFCKHGILAFRIAIVLYFVFFPSTCTYRPANYESRPVKERISWHMNSAEIRSSLGTILWMLRWTNETVWLTISLKLLLQLEQLRESSVPGLVLYFVFFPSTCTYRPANYESRPGHGRLVTTDHASIITFLLCVNRNEREYDKWMKEVDHQLMSRFSARLIFKKNRRK